MISLCTQLVQCAHVASIDMLYLSELQCLPLNPAAFKCMQCKVKID